MDLRATSAFTGATQAPVAPDGQHQLASEPTGRKTRVIELGVILVLLISFAVAAKTVTRPKSLTENAAGRLRTLLETQGLTPGNIEITCPPGSSDSTPLTCTASIEQANAPVPIEITTAADTMLVVPKRRLISQQMLAATSLGRVTCQLPAYMFVAEPGSTVMCTIDAAPAVFTVGTDGRFER